MKATINQIKRRALQGFTSIIASNEPKALWPTNKNHKSSRILIVRPNHRLGNQILISPIIDELIAAMPDCKIDILAQGGLSHVLYRQHPNIDQLITLPRKPFKELGTYLKTLWNLRAKSYDFSINAVQNSSSGRLYTMLAKARYKIIGQENDLTILHNHTDYKHIAKYQLYTVRNYMQQLGIQMPTGDPATLTIFLTNAEKESAKKILDAHVPVDKKTIAIYTFATGAKCLPPAWWIPFYERLKATYPTYNILEILPMENVSQVDFAAPHYYSRDIREMAGVMANTAVWIGADCGIMHLASASNIPVIGLFSGQNHAMYRPYGNSSTAVIQPENYDFENEIFKALETILH